MVNKWKEYIRGLEINSVGIPPKNGNYGREKSVKEIMYEIIQIERAHQMPAEEMKPIPNILCKMSKC